MPNEPNYGTHSLTNKLKAAFSSLPKTNDLLWKQHHDFATSYSLQECLKQLQNLDKSSGLSNFKLEPTENTTDKRNVKFTFSHQNAKITVGLLGQIEAQNDNGCIVTAEVGIYYSNFLLPVGFCHNCPYIYVVRNITKLGRKLFVEFDWSLCHVPRYSIRTFTGCRIYT